MTDRTTQLQMAEHMLDHARDHVVVLAAANLADLVRRHRPSANRALLVLASGAHGRLLTPALGDDAMREADACARHLNDETWSMWECLADEDHTDNPQSGTRILAVDLALAAEYVNGLPDPTGANCPRTCPIWREDGIGVPDIGPCHSCGARPGQDCHEQHSY